MELEFKKEKVENMKLNEAKQLARVSRFDVRYVIVQYHAVDDSMRTELGTAGLWDSPKKPILLHLKLHKPESDSHLTSSEWLEYLLSLWKTSQRQKNHSLVLANSHQKVLCSFSRRFKTCWFSYQFTLCRANLLECMDCYIWYSIRREREHNLTKKKKKR